MKDSYLSEATERRNMLTTMEDQIQLANKEEDSITVVIPYDMQEEDRLLEKFYQSLNHSHADPLRLAANFFLGKPYFLEPLGEGKTAPYSEEPLYRGDKFDCVSYVNTVLALVKSNNLEQFKHNILRVRYEKGNVSYTKKTDWFTDLEWIPNAQDLGWIKEATQEIVDENGQGIFLTAFTTIDKHHWYEVKPLKVIHRLSPLPNINESKQLLKQLRHEGKAFAAYPSKLTYLPFAKLFFQDGTPDIFLFNQIPSASVIAVVRPNWAIKDEFPGFPSGYGTNLNVSHLGLVIRTAEDLMFYHASSVHQRVEVVPLSEYLKEYLDSPTIKGIHVEKIIY